ncbi:MAG: DUF3014 domain-containing protein [Pseudomonadales bacterium]
MQDKIIPAVITVMAIIALIFIVKYIIVPAPSSKILEESAPLQTTQIVRETPSPESAEPEHSAPPKPLPIAEKPLNEPAILPPPPSLEDSDTQVLLAVADFAPALIQWLIPEQQIRKWVLAIDLMADGKLPKRYRPVDYPMDKFVVEQQGLDTVAAADNHPRMNAIISTLTSIKPSQLVQYYRQWSPLLEKAYREQGKPDTFNQRLQQAINHVLAAKPLSDNPALTRPSVLYRYRDESFELATDIDKLLWRMGPENSARLQNFLRELHFQLGQ